MAQLQGPDGVPTELTPAQSRTLRAGSTIVLGSVTLGLQLGRWPLWTIVLAAALYVAWTVAYAEATVQAMRRSAGKAEPQPG